MFKTISTAYPNGYTLMMPTFSGLSITSAGSVGGTGVFIKAAGTVINAGKINATLASAVVMEAGGVVSNFGSMNGYDGVWGPSIPFGGKGGTTTVINSGVLDGQHNGVSLLIGGNVTNSGTIAQTLGGYATEQSDGVYDLAGTVSNTGKIIASYNKAKANYHSAVAIGSGKVINGAFGAAATALLKGYYGVDASGKTTVTNYATISGVYAGVKFAAGGHLTNGGTYDTTALIEGQIQAVISASAGLNNYGTIESGLRAVSTGGDVVNGAAFDTTALIEAPWLGIATTAKSADIYNWGTIEATALDRQAIALDGGTLTNGAANDTVAFIGASLGVSVQSGGSVRNFGLIKATYTGVTFYDGGTLTNGSAASTTAMIEGDAGVIVKAAAGTIANFGTLQSLNPGSGGITDGAYLKVGGTVTNGAVDDTVAVIKGSSGVVLGTAGKVVNYGLIDGVVGTGVSLATGGVVSNGAATDSAALIEGLLGVLLGGAGTVNNFGTVSSTSAKAGAVALNAGGAVVNGVGADRTALIQGALGVSLAGVAGTVVNYATISGLNGPGVTASAGATVTNGGGADRTALIEGLSGVYVASGAGTLRNFATIRGEGGSGTFGVYLKTAGALTNGAASDKAALIEGYGGVEILGAGSSQNFGTIRGLGATGQDFGVDIGQGANMMNGGATDAAATIEGYVGAELGGSSTLTNYGTVLGAGGVAVKFDSAAATLVVEAGSSLDGIVQGDGGHLLLASGMGQLALQSGKTLTVTGVIPTDTFDNFASVAIGAHAVFTVAGGGTIVSGQTLIDDGSVADAGTLNVAGGGTLSVAGALAGMGTLAATGGTVTLAAGAGLAIAAVTISGGSTVAASASLDYAGAWSQSAGTLSVSSGTTMSLSGAVALAGAVTGKGTLALSGGTATLAALTATIAALDVAGASVTLNGATTVTGGTLAVNAGALNIGGTLAGTGTLAVSGGTVTLATGTDLTVANLTVSGAAAVNDDVSLAYAGTWSQTGGALTVAGGVMATFTGSGDIFGGTLVGTGTVDLAAGTASLAATTIATGTQVDAAGAAVTLSGAIANGGTITESGGSLIVAAGGASLTGAGIVTLGTLPTDTIVGASAAATLTLGQVLQGAGDIGDGTMTLDVLASGIIRSEGPDQLTIDTGTNPIANAGAIESVGAGGTTVVSAVVNAGRLVAQNATLTVEGAVTGAGHGVVENGTLDLTASANFSQNVVFTGGASGTLELANSQAYGGTISGFSLTGATALDLVDIAFAAGATTATYAGSVTRGILTVTDGTHTATIHLRGNYMASTWTLASDGHGGTTVVDPAKPPSGSGFIQAMATLAAPPAHAASGQDAWLPSAPMLASPRGAAA